MSGIAGLCAKGAWITARAISRIKKKSRAEEVEPRGFWMLSDWIGKRKEEMWIDKNCSRFHFNWLRMSARHPRISQTQLTMREMENSTKPNRK
jgi:hypothetical protein